MGASRKLKGPLALVQPFPFIEEGDDALLVEGNHSPCVMGDDLKIGPLLHDPPEHEAGQRHGRLIGPTKEAGGHVLGLIFTPVLCLCDSCGWMEEMGRL